MKKSFWIVSVVMMWMLLVGSAYAGPVKCTWADKDDNPHPAISGQETALRAVVVVPEDAATPLTYSWDYGDGTADAEPVALDDPDNIEAAHTYTGSVGTIITATLSVYDANGASLGSDTYRVKISDNNLATRKAIAVERGLWWFHKGMERYTIPMEYADGSTADVPAAVVGRAFVNRGRREYAEGVIMDAQAFVNQGFLATGNADNPYTDDVIRLVNHVTDNLGIMQLTNRIASAEDRRTGGMKDGLGVYFAANDETEYGFGLALQLLATCGYTTQKPAAFNNVYNNSPINPATGERTVAGLNAWTYLQIVQQMADWIAWAQLETCSNDYSMACSARDPETNACLHYNPPAKDCTLAVSSTRQGGWPYWREGWGTAGEFGDASIAYWTTLGLRAADKLAIPYPSYVKSNLKKMLFNQQNSSSGEVYFGPLKAYHLVERAGQVLTMYKWLNISSTDSRVTRARDYISSNWAKHNYQHNQNHPGEDAVSTSPTGKPCLTGTTPDGCYSHYDPTKTVTFGHWEYGCDDAGNCQNNWIVDMTTIDTNLFGIMTVTEGLKAYGFTNIPSGTGPYYVERYGNILVNNQFPSGGWDDTGWADGNPFGTAWAIWTLGRL